MSPDITEAIRHEHNATVEAVQRAQSRAVHVGELLLEIRATMEPFAWITWLETKCPIPKSAAHRYLNQARMLRKVAQPADRLRRIAVERRSRLEPYWDTPESRQKEALPKQR